MRILILKNYLLTITAVITFSLAVQAVPKPTVVYTLTWDGQTSYVDIELAYNVIKVDSTVFKFGLPGFGGQQDIFTLVENLKGSSGDIIKTLKSSSKVIVYHKSGGTHKLFYRINGSVNTDNMSRAIYMELFRPVITKGSLYLTPPFFMMMPDVSEPVEMSIQFKGLPSHTPVFYSWSPLADAGKKVLIPPGKMGDFLIAAGSGVKTKTYDVHHIPYYLVTQGNDTINNINTELSPYFKSYFPSLRDYWKDDKGSSYYVYLSQLQTTKKNTVGGLNWGGGFILKYYGKFDTWKKEMIAHETSHTWIGSKMIIGKNSFEQQWFGEGFNDYVCLITLYHSGIFSQDTLISYVNKTVLQKHYTSKVNIVPNDSIAAMYWKDKAYEKLPYTRGTIFAFYLDNQIRLSSGGKYTLRNMLLDLLAKTQEIKAVNENANLTLNDFIDIAALYLDRTQVKEDLNNYMIKGHLIDLEKVKLCPEFNITNSQGVPVLSVNAGKSLKGFYSW